MSFVGDNTRKTILKEQEEGGHLWKLNQEAEKIRKKYGWDYVDYRHLPAPGFRQGGVVDYTGIANLHGSPNSAEVVFNAEQAKKLYEFVNHLPTIVPNTITSRIPHMKTPSLKIFAQQA